MANINNYGIEDIKSLSFREAPNRVIYKHTCIITNQVYIGQTNNITVRWKPSAYKHCVKFYNAIQKYGWDNFTHEILEDHLTLSEANQKENYYITLYDSVNKGYNLNYGGDSKLASAETKEKMSQTRKGVPHSYEHCQAISKALQGYKQTEEHRQNNRRAQHRKPVECIETGIKYDSLAEAGRQTGIRSETISRQIRGLQHSTQGLHWRYINESELYSK